MPATPFQYLSILSVCFLAVKALEGLPDKIYGVNIGSWLVLEPWMLPAEWVSMGGQICDDCSKCISTEFDFVKTYPTTADAKFKEHWETWFTQGHIQELKSAGINTVRIPLGYWIVEPLVDRSSEFFPKGGILQLQRGLADLKAANIAVILDHHALPGVASPNQMFAGRCTIDVQFYTPHNYHRALVWTAVMTAISHLDPKFAAVAALEAINEPIMDASQTPGLGEFEKNFVETVRAVEISLGISDPEEISPPDPAFSEVRGADNVTSAISACAKQSSVFSAEILQVLADAVPIISQVSEQLHLNTAFDQGGLRDSLASRKPLITNFMDINWQHNNPANPADAAIGPQGYDNHLYYSFGGVADPTEEAYLTHVCNLDRIQTDAALGNSPLWFGEWGLSTQFDATDDFLKKWADAQKFSYGKGAGWLFWNFKIEVLSDKARQWSYLEGLKRGYLTQDPSQFHDPQVCDHYIKAPTIDSNPKRRHRRRRQHD